jgi:nicotinamide riboside kinase
MGGPTRLKRAVRLKDMTFVPRVAIDGAQSTGKTTLWRQLKEHYGAKLLFIAEAAREIAPAFGVFEANHWSPLLSNTSRLAAFFAAEEEWQVRQEQTASGGFVSDSSLFLIQAYRATFGLPLNEVVLKQAHYNALFHCATTNSFTPDGFRFIARRQEIEHAYRQIAKQRIPGIVIELPAQNRLDRAVAVIDILIAKGKIEG